MAEDSGPVAVVFILLLFSVGCVGIPPGSGTTPDPATATSTDTPAAGDGSHPTDRHEAATDQAHAGKEVRLRNSWNETVSVHVEVIRNATDQTVHDGTYSVAPDDRRTVYNVSAADPDGIESFTTVVTARNETQQVTIETNRC